MKQKHMVVIMSVAIAILLILSVFEMVSKDRKSPIITIPEEEITYQEGEDTAILLEGVKAWDDVDRDLTAELRVDSIIPDKSETTADVTYAVYDSSNNVTKVKRTVTYLTETEAEKGKTDKENDQQESQEVTNDEAQESVQGEDNTTEEVAVNDSNPVIRLTEQEFRIVRGGDFTPLNHIADLTDDKDNRSALFRRVSVEGEYNVNVPGSYELQYYCIDSDGNQSNVETLTLVVE